MSVKKVVKHHTCENFLYETKKRKRAFIEKNLKEENSYRKRAHKRTPAERRSFFSTSVRENQSEFVTGKTGNAVEALFQVGIGRNVVAHGAVVKRFVGFHIEVTGSG